MNVHENWYEEAKTLNVENLPHFIDKLLNDYGHDYGTIVHAMSAAMMGTMYTMNNHPSGGITGFQASCVKWMIIKELTMEKGPMTLLTHENMLYPQYEYKYKTINTETWEWLQGEAEKKLKEEDVSPRVRGHWLSIVSGEVPFGFEVEDV